MQSGNQSTTLCLLELAKKEKADVVRNADLSEMVSMLAVALPWHRGIWGD
jgi:hypothetical protein